LGSGQEGLVLPDSSQRLPADGAAATANHAATSANYASTAADHATTTANRASEARRPIQLCRWFCELAGWVVGPKEGVVLQGSRERVPQPGRRWMYDVI